MNLRHYVYGLLDPRSSKPTTERIFYIGQTMRPKERLDAHIASASEAKKAARIDEILRSGHKPQMEILDSIDDEAWGSNTPMLVASIEQEWIAKLGTQVLNRPTKFVEKLWTARYFVR